MKYIFVSGGVISGLGKGVTVASLANTLQARGYSVSPVKIDMYLNIDAGILNPKEHGEVFVTDDGTETDQDIGNYERFLGKNLSSLNYMTTGQIYKSVIDKERAFYYGGKTVEVIPHVTDEIINRIRDLGEKQKADIVIAEMGGTVGEYQNDIFFEAGRLLKLENPRDLLHIHVAYLPIPRNLGEMKTKPLQQSVRLLNERGLSPDFLVGRYDTEGSIDLERKKKIALFCNITFDEVISNPGIGNIYEIPLLFEEQRFSEKVLHKLGLNPFTRVNMDRWINLIEKIMGIKKEITIGLVGKYFDVGGGYVLSDVYISVIEALKHASWINNCKPLFKWIDSDRIEKEGEEKLLRDLDGIVVPGGFGEKKIDGIYRGIKFARENKIPYLGLCYGMQLAAIEFARNVCNLEADSTEINQETPCPLIHIMPEQEKKLLRKDYGATMRLGNWECILKENTLVHKIYGMEKISERHRHRYEFNNKYKENLEEKGMIFSGSSPYGDIVEIMELPEKSHPFFVGVQFHPEFKSHPLNPSPLFKAFIEKCLKNSGNNLL